MRNDQQLPHNGIKEGPIQLPEVAAQRFLDACKKALDYPSGSFLDVRTIAERTASTRE